MSQNTFFKVNFVVENQNGESIENAKVTFLFKGAPEVEFTKSSGYVQHSIPIRDSVEIKIEKKGYKTKRETINCLPGRDKVFTFRLEKLETEKNHIFRNFLIFFIILIGFSGIILGFKFITTQLLLSKIPKSILPENTKSQVPEIKKIEVDKTNNTVPSKTNKPVPSKTNKPVPSKTNNTDTTQYNKGVIIDCKSCKREGQRIKCKLIVKTLESKIDSFYIQAGGSLDSNNTRIIDELGKEIIASYAESDSFKFSKTRGVFLNDLIKDTPREVVIIFEEIKSEINTIKLLQLYVKKNNYEDKFEFRNITVSS